MEKIQVIVTSELQNIFRTLNDPLLKVSCFPVALKTRSTHSSSPKIYADLEEGESQCCTKKTTCLSVYGTVCIFNVYSFRQSNKIQGCASAYMENKRIKFKSS